LDGWISSSHRSIWNFIVLTLNRKEYLYRLFDLSENSYIGEYLADQIKDVINSIKSSKFFIIVSDNAQNIKKA